MEFEDIEDSFLMLSYVFHISNWKTLEYRDDSMIQGQISCGSMFPGEMDDLSCVSLSRDEVIKDVRHAFVRTYRKGYEYFNLECRETT